MHVPAPRRPARRLPDALVVGPQRAGTTWIHQYLASRGDVRLPRLVKETYFFDRRYHRGAAWYARRFGPSVSDGRVVEVASTYFHHAAAPRRVVETLGRVPSICTLRHPVNRAASLYWHYRRYGMTRLDFRAAVATIPDIRDSLQYATHLRRWQAALGRDRVLVLLLEVLAADPQAYTKQICEHFDLPSVELDPALQRPANGQGTARHALLASAATAAAHAAHGCGLSWIVSAARSMGLRDWLYGRDGSGPKETLAEHDRRWLAARVRTEIDELEELLDRDLTSWKTTPRPIPAAA